MEKIIKKIMLCIGVFSITIVGGCSSDTKDKEEKQKDNKTEENKAQNSDKKNKTDDKKATDDKKSPTIKNEEPKSAKNEPYIIKGILLVNKNHGLPKEYGKTDSTALAALGKLQKGARNAGHTISTLSGYRSYSYQVELYNNYVKRDGKAAADRYSARPGFSEHQSGLCFDIGDIDNDYGKTAAGKWLAKNCATYGFIIRYPEGKEDITGYMYEPWHVRYVGKDVAKSIMDNNSTLEEYLGVR